MMKTTLAALVTCSLLAAPASAQDAGTIIAAASKAIGAAGITSVTFQGSALSVGATGAPAGSKTVARYQRTIDFSRPASLAVAESTGSPRNVQSITSADAWETQLEIWLTPWGFLRGAAANNATVRTRTIGGEKVYVISWDAPVRSPNGEAYRVVGYVSARTYHVNGVETWIDAPSRDQAHVQALYGEWRDGANGFRFPSVMVQQRAGRRTFEAAIATAEANPANLQSLMAAAATPAS
jgi:hypothetical protein